MSSTYLSLHYHVVFSTKRRFPFIHHLWRSRLHEYMGGIIRRLGGVPECVGGIGDHVHILMGLNSTHCLADVMCEVKKNSSSWIHETIGEKKFEWQEGYAAFTVSATARETVRQYIERQEEHHRVKLFRVEVIEMLKNAGVTFDSKYLS